MNSDFFTQLQLIRSKHQHVVSQVVKDVVGLFGSNFSLTLEDYFTQLEFLARAADLTPRSGAGISRRSIRQMRDRLMAALAATIELSTDVATRQARGCERHEKLVEHIAPKDTVISFNYDCVLDHALRMKGAKKWSSRYGYTFPVPSRVIGHQYWDAEDPPESSAKTVRLLKLHGSLNWQLPGSQEGPIKLKQRLHAQNGIPRFSIIPPVWNKSSDSEPTFQTLWQNAERAIRNAEQISIVGFSFTPTDLHVESLFRVALAKSRLGQLVIANPSKPDRSRIRQVFSQPLQRGALVTQYEGFAEFIDDLPGLFS